jgi:hypothetical protein
MTHRTEQNSTDRIIARLRGLPEVSPPAGLRREIMAQLSPKRLGLLTRLRRFWFQPHTVTFVPIKWAPMLAGLLLVAVIPRLSIVDRTSEMSTPSIPTQQASLTLTFEHPDARKVALIGTFNQWTPDEQVKTEKEGDLWTFHLNVAPGRYEYAFLVDGRDVVADPRAVFHRHNGFGTPNAVVYATVNGQNNI